MADTGRIIVFSAPSGGGKGTIINRVMKDDPRLVYSVSATTRPPRPGEINGKDYLFLTRDEFQIWIEDDQFVEWAEVHGEFYGTPKDLLGELLKSRHDVILELDVQGMRQVADLDIGPVVSIFIAPPSLEVLEKRLRSRGDLSEEQLAVRLENAKRELAARDKYDHVVVNDDVDAAVEKVETILQKTRS